MNTYCIYCLSKVRSTEIAVRFLDHFLPDRTPCAADYPFPEFQENPARVFLNPLKLLAVLEAESFEPYSLYWNRESDGTGNDPIDQGMLFFTADQALIVGLAVTGATPVGYLREMARVIDAEYGFVTGEEFPAETTVEFIQLCEKAELGSLVAGQLDVDGL